MTSLDACFGLPGGRYTTSLNKIPDVTAAFWLIALKAASFALWFKMEGTLSIHDDRGPTAITAGFFLSPICAGMPARRASSFFSRRTSAS
ncbi:hypothetical protein [Celeribacter sp.]|uniref:hypothetical protein n=1 Tax=Celeribacter sp. TaxID=1890673 RepID=UPI003A92CD3B